MSVSPASMSVSPDIKKKEQSIIGYQNEVKKCGLILHLKFDKVEEAKLDASGFQCGITNFKVAYGLTG